MCVTLTFHRKHLYADLRPYTCFYAVCPYNQHPFSTRQLWSDHLELGHDFGPAWQPVQCFLCLEMTGEGKSTILSHFARHMEDISLVALPPTVDSDEESESSSVAAGSLEIKSDIGDEIEVTDSLKRDSALASIHTSIGKKQQNRYGPFSVQLYQLKNNAWASIGLGSCSCALFEGKACLTVNEDESGRRLLEAYPTKEGFFKKEQDTYIVWTHEDDTNMALSFLESADCRCIWSILQEGGNLSGTSNAADITPKSPEETTRGLQISPGSDEVKNTNRTPSVRQQRPDFMCEYCNERPDGFCDIHMFARIARTHTASRKSYICVAPDFDKTFLDDCKHCRSRKVYGAYYNAAAHLRRAHFHPKGKVDEKRGGIGGGHHTAMDWLKQYWIRELDVQNELSASPEDDGTLPGVNDDVDEPPTRQAGYDMSESIRHSKMPQLAASASQLPGIESFDHAQTTFPVPYNNNNHFVGYPLKPDQAQMHRSQSGRSPWPLQPGSSYHQDIPRDTSPSIAGARDHMLRSQSDYISRSNQPDTLHMPPHDSVDSLFPVWPKHSPVPAQQGDHSRDILVGDDEFNEMINVNAKYGMFAAQDEYRDGEYAEHKKDPDSSKNMIAQTHGVLSAQNKSQLNFKRRPDGHIDVEGYELNLVTGRREPIAGHSTVWKFCDFPQCMSKFKRAAALKRHKLIHSYSRRPDGQESNAPKAP